MVLQVLLHDAGAKPVTVILPLRPSLAREADALTLSEEVAPAVRPDGEALARGLEEMDRIPSLALSGSQREDLLRTVRQLAEEERTSSALLGQESVRAFRETFMRVSVAALASLRPDQVRFLVEHHQEFNLQFEASYWHTLRRRLESDPERPPTE